MKYIFFLLLFPLSGVAQKSYKEQRAEMKAAQAEADTMRFPVPFEFKYIDSIALPRGAIYSKCFQWLTVVLGNPKQNLQIQDSLNGKLVITHVEAVTSFNSETITIDVKEGKYRLTIDQYENTDFRDVVRPLDSLQNSKGVRLDKYLMVKLNEATFKSLHDYVRKNDNF